MILSSDKIKEMCEHPKRGRKALILPYTDSIFYGNPAKVELRLGDYCYCSSNEREIISLKDRREVTVKPNEIFLFQTREKVNMPVDLAGRMSLKMSLVSKGLLMPNQTQVDPGYSNYLFGMLYNLSTNEIKLTYEQSITTLEITEAMPNQTSYYGAMANITFEKFVSTRISSSLGEMARDVEQSKKKLDASADMWNKILTGLSVAVGVVAAVATVMSWVGASSKNADVAVLEGRVDSLEATVGEQTRQLEEYRRRLEEAGISLQDEAADPGGPEGTPGADGTQN